MKQSYFFNKKESYLPAVQIPPRFRFYFTVAVPAMIILATLGVLRIAGELPMLEYREADIHTAVVATLATLARLMIAYVLAIVVAIPLALLAEKSNAKRFLLPVYDIAQSIPILIFFPFVALAFVKLGFSEGAAIFILFIAMLWKLVFSIIFGLNSLPSEIKQTAQMYNITGVNYLTKILLPAIIPQLTIGSIFAFADGWNFVIVAEVLHAYLPNGVVANDLFGVGSTMVGAASAGNETLFTYSLIAVVSMVIVLNLSVWQRLLAYAERFKF